MKLFALIPLIFVTQTYAKPSEVLAHINSQNKNIFQFIKGKNIPKTNINKKTSKNIKIKPQKITRATSASKAKILSKPTKQPIITKINTQTVSQNKTIVKDDSLGFLNNLGEGQLNQIMGEKNSFFGDLNKIIGIQNLVIGNENKIVGEINVAKGDNNIIIGNQNKVKGSDNIVNGNNNKVQGINNILKGDSKAQGQFNKILENEKTIFTNNKIFDQIKQSKQKDFKHSKAFQQFDITFKGFDDIFNDPFFTTGPYRVSSKKDKKIE